MASSESPVKHSKRTIILGVLTLISFLAFFVFMCLLAVDVFTIPYLTPLAHFLAIIIAPFVPLIAPLMLGAFLKVVQHPPFPGKKTWVLITACWVVNQVARVCKDVGRLWSFTGTDDELEICGLRECKGSWVEVGLLLLVVLGQWRGWRWDLGMLDKWVEGIVEQAVKTEEAKQALASDRNVEEGMAQDGKKEIEEVVGGDMEKTPLLLDVEEKSVEKV